MENLKKIKLPWLEDVFPFLCKELEMNEDLWEIDRRRQQKLRIMQHTKNILLRFPDEIPDQGKPDNVMEITESVFASAFPYTMRLLGRICEEMHATLGRVFFTSIQPNAVVFKHLTTGSYYDAHERYYMVIKCEGDAIVQCGEDTATMKPGELWWVNNKQYRESLNNSSGWRSQLVFDLQHKSPLPNSLYSN